MAKEFNITGTCIPSRHYMADLSGKLSQIMDLVEKGQYFTMNRPRQYGKTTILFQLSQTLNHSNAYLAFNISFEGIGSAVFSEEILFCQAFLDLLANPMLEIGNNELAAFLLAESRKNHSFKQLSGVITELAYKTERKIILLIDEVDKSSDNQLFLDFLGLLRYKFLNRHLKTEKTFHSVILAGVHDVRTLKLKLHPGEEAKYNSPWNIAADFKVNMSLLPDEIVPMLEDFSPEQNISMNTPDIADRLYYFTSGYPFLVSALCKIVAEEILPQKREPIWALQDVETAADLLIKSSSSNTNFDSLIKNLENNESLYNLVYSVAVDGETYPFNIHDPLINLGMIYGIFGQRPTLTIHNRIYSEVVVNYMTSKLLTSSGLVKSQSPDPYMAPGNRLNFEKVLIKFQEYMRGEYSKKDRNFLERYGRLVFLAFLKPIINGKSYAFKETEISEERRLDIAVTFFQHKYVVELKVWRGEAAHQKGLSQLAGYLDRLHLTEGYLLIFDPAGPKNRENRWLEIEGKKLLVAWV